MKFLKTALIATILGFASAPSLAATTVIKFAKGSYCGSFTGKFAGRTFVLYLGKGQELVIISSVDLRSVVVNGESVYYDEGVYMMYTKRKGKHTIKLIPYPGQGYGSIEFCAQ